MMNMTMSLPGMQPLPPHLHFNHSRTLAAAAQPFPKTSCRVWCGSARRRLTVRRKSEKAQTPKKRQWSDSAAAAVSVGVMMVMVMGMDAEKAMALGPEGPLMEEFWDNVRRYGLYALTVSTGALSAVFEPIFDLLKNPISAILIFVILGGSFYIVSQVVSAMTGLTEFAYDYGY